MMSRASKGAAALELTDWDNVAEAVQCRALRDTDVDSRPQMSAPRGILAAIPPIAAHVQIPSVTWLCDAQHLGTADEPRSARPMSWPAD